MKTLIVSLAMVPVALSATSSQAQNLYPKAATEAKQKFDTRVKEVETFYHEVLAALQKEYQERMATARKDYDEQMADATDTYLEELESTRKAEADAGRNYPAQLVQYAIDYLKNGPPRTDVQKLWIESFTAEAEGDFHRAVETTRKVFEIDGENSNNFVKAYANSRIGQLFLKQNEHDMAIASYQAAAKAMPRGLSPLTGLIFCYTAKGDNERTITAAQSLLRLDPVNYLANKTLADIYYKQKNYTESAKYFRRLLSAYPDDLEVLTNFAWCYYAAGKPEPAKKMFTAVLSIQPDNASAGYGFTSIAGDEAKKQAAEKAAAEKKKTE